MTNDLRYDVVRLERDKRTIVASGKSLADARSIVTETHGASALPLFWCVYGLSYIAVTADGAAPTTPLVARWLVQRSE